MEVKYAIDIHMSLASKYDTAKMLSKKFESKVGNSQDGGPQSVFI